MSAEAEPFERLTHTSEPPANTTPGAELVLGFLESIGRRSDAELYLRLFRSLPRQSFGCIALEPAVLRHAVHSLAQQLSFMAELGLCAPLLVGAFGGGASRAEVERLVARLHEANLPAARVPADTASADLAEQLGRGQFPVLVLERTRERAALHGWLSGLLTDLGSRKLVLLRTGGGLGPSNQRVELGPGHVLLPALGGGLSVINLETDEQPLYAAGLLSPVDAQLLRLLSELVRDRAGLQVSVASPLNLLRELFTVRGAGTLIKRGTLVQRHTSYQDVDTARLRALLETAFGKRLVPSFLERTPLAVYLEAEYRGAVVLEPGLGDIAFLTKFVVDRVAQGEGMGRDLWQAVVRDHPAFYWRARSGNPIAAWYQEVCDGMLRSGPWCVYWRSAPVAQVPELVADALARAEDFTPPSR